MLKMILIKMIILYVIDIQMIYIFLTKIIRMKKEHPLWMPFSM